MAEDRIEDEGVSMTAADPQDYAFVLKRERQQMGWAGILVGNKDHAPTGVACVVSLILIFAMAASAIWGGDDRIELIKTFGSFLIGALGFLFGSLTANRR